jgi:hypothetical protein
MADALDSAAAAVVARCSNIARVMALNYDGTVHSPRPILSRA